MQKNDAADKKYMRMAIALAKKGAGKTCPNPAVGALIVKNGRVIAADYHRKAGMPHAEALVMKKAGENAAGAVLYCTLEPCAHYGRTPPCAEAIIKSGIKRAVFAMKDPNPVNNGKGMAILKKAGVMAECGLLSDEAASLNRAFIKFMKRRIPYVTVKIAESLDGKIADGKGNSKWITSAESRRFAHKLRGQNDAVMVGVNTLLKDDPLLNNRRRPRQGKQPLRVVLDAKLRIPPGARILKDLSAGGAVLVAAGKGASPKKKSALEKMGAKVILLPEESGRIALIPLLRHLAGCGIMSLLCEGGGELISDLIRNRLADEIYFFIAPKIIGGRTSPTSCGGSSADIKKCAQVRNIKIGRIGHDILIRGEL